MNTKELNDCLSCKKYFEGFAYRRPQLVHAQFVANIGYETKIFDSYQEAKEWFYENLDKDDWDGECKFAHVARILMSVETNIREDV